MADQVRPIVANIACFLFAFMYVAGLYVIQRNHQHSRKLSRDHPLVIKNRIKSVIITSCIVLVLVWLILPAKAKLAQALGLILPHSVTEMLGLLGPVLATVILFLGPLCQMYFERTLIFQEYSNTTEDIKNMFLTLLGLRNYVVGPITEEIVFRSCMVPVLYQAGYSRSYIIFITPLYFGLAHLHHMCENYYRLGANKEALVRAAITSVCQFTYTTLFGWYVTFIFMRHGNVWSPIMCHTFCNIMGFPDLSDMLLRTKAEQRVIYCAYLIGLFLFIRLLYPLTDPDLVGGSSYWA